LIKARQFDTDQAGEAVEHIQLNDGRVFTRMISNAQTGSIPRTSNTRLWNGQLVIHD
jgi:hypothetical protein